MVQSNKITILRDEAEKSKKKYNWIEASGVYENALEVALCGKDYSEAADLSDDIGYCLFRAALQAETKEQFETRMRLSAEAYGKMDQILRRIGNEAARTNHAHAMTALTRSWVEQDFSIMEALLDEWWNLENKALVAYENQQNLIATGKACNNLMEYSADRRVFFNHREMPKRVKELIIIGDKAIAALKKTTNKNELARAYCWTGWYYGKGGAGGTAVRKSNLEKMEAYENKALSIAKDLGDGWLIGWSYNALSDSSFAVSLHNKDFTSWLQYALKILEQGQATRDNLLMATGKWKAGMTIHSAMEFEEDPEKKRQETKKAVQWNKEAISQALLINAPIPLLCSQLVYCTNLIRLGSLETDFKEKRRLMEEAVKVGRESLDYSKGKAWGQAVFPVAGLSYALLWLSKIDPNTQEKRRYLEEALKMRQDARASRITFNSQDPKAVPSRQIIEGAYQIALLQSEIAKLENEKDRKVAMFDEAVLSWEECAAMSERAAEAASEEASKGWYEGFINYDFGGVLSQVYSLTEEIPKALRAIDLYKKAIVFFKKFELPIHAAESYWKLALIHSLLGEHLEASKNYELSAEAYKETIEMIPQLRSFLGDQTKYMSAWSQIEKAMYHHAREEHHEARKAYEDAATFHEGSTNWSYMAPNYWAWADLENAELLSRQEKPKEAIYTFEQAQTRFRSAEDAIAQKIKEIDLPEEKQVAEKRVKAATLRQGYCQARISIEKAKIFDRKGEYASSAKNYELAAGKLVQFLSDIELTQTKQEFSLLLKLCEAWQQMESAEEKNDPEKYFEAAQRFEEAKTYSSTKKIALLILGNSSFCKGLAAGIRYQTSLEIEEYNLAKGHLKNAATSYLQACYSSASEYAKATQRLFDAYVFMNRAEGEVDPKSRAKQYQMAEKLLQISAESFTKAKQPEKTSQVKHMLKTVKEEKAMAISLDEVLHAPAEASITTSFASPNPEGETSIGLERFEHANVQANLVCSNQRIRVGETFSLEVEFINAGKQPALLIKVEEIVPEDFLVAEKPEIYRLENTCLNMKGKQLAALKALEVKLILQPSMEGIYQIKPVVRYLDELGQEKTLRLKSLEITVESVILEGRLSTGTKELDQMLLGGIPAGYVVGLTASPSNERDLLIRNFLEAGAKEDQITFYIATEAVALESLVKKSSFYLFLCNSEPNTQFIALPNVYKLRSKTDLNNLNIALTKAYRTINQDLKSPKRLCVEVVSDILLDYGPKTTRKWLSELITDLTQKGFITLAVVDPNMHPQDHLHAVLNLFDGEISLHETQAPYECKKSLRITKLGNQDYIKNPLCLTRQKL
jgi:KaiC/GvpD/RAD55 family RecA-like ATPase